MHLKTRFDQTEKKFSRAGASEIIYKKWSVLAKKCVSITRNEAFVEKFVMPILTRNQRNWFPLAGGCFSFIIRSP